MLETIQQGTINYTYDDENCLRLYVWNCWRINGWKCSGTMGKSDAGEGQFWSLENPLSEDYADKMGIPPENYKFPDFVESGTLIPGTNFITRTAPGVGGNKGGGIEVVVSPNGVKLNSFNTLE